MKTLCPYLSRTTLGLLLLTASAAAHTGPVLKDNQLPPPSPIFGLPFAGLPGPDTWMVGQAYGNTTEAYTLRNVLYQFGQGIHFGLDLSAQCGTPVLAIGDGVVQEVDGSHGSPPHNLVIDHGNGLSSLYGHLLQKPSLKVGQKVKKGQVVALSGDSEFTCHSSPHLHLEIRDRSHVRFFNPTLYIKADWDSIYLQGIFFAGFQRDLSNVRKWQHPDDQPSAMRGGPLLNHFVLTWPPDQQQSTPMVGKFAGFQPSDLPWPETETRLTEGGCCPEPRFTPDGRQVMFIDQPSRDAPLGWYATAPGKAVRPLLPLGWYASDFTQQAVPGPLFAKPSGLWSDSTWEVPAGVQEVHWSPVSQTLVWNEVRQEGTSDNWPVTVQVRGPHALAGAPLTVYGGGARGFLDNHTLLVAGKLSPKDRAQLLFSLDLQTGSRRLLEESPDIRRVTVSPGGRRVAYYVSFQKDRKNGLFVVDREGQKTSVPLFGSYRWRDEGTLLLVPLTEAPRGHTVWQWKVGAAGVEKLVELAGKISYDQWVVSPDGQNLAYVNAGDRNVYGFKLP